MVIENEMDVLSLLRSKSRCLKKLASISLELLLEVKQENFENLDRFHCARNAVLKAIQLYDRNISESLSRLANRSAQELQLGSAFSESLKKLYVEHEAQINQIVSIDREIILRIEIERDSLVREVRNIASSEKSNILFQKFKSKWVPDPGEKLDGKI